MGPEISGARVAVAGPAADAINVTGGPVIGLDILEQGNGGLPVRSASALAEGVYMITTSNYAHIAFGISSVAADANDALLAPGERMLIIPSGSYVSVVGIGNDAVNDIGIIRLTKVQ